MKASQVHGHGNLDPHSTLFQIGRLLFPELINRGRAMRLRMVTIALTLGIGLAVTTSVILWKEYGTTRGHSTVTRPLK